MLDDYLTAPMSERLRATMNFLEKVTLLPADVGGDDIQRLHLAGVTDQAIREALLVCFLTGILDRWPSRSASSCRRHERASRWPF
jgi:alkylhydroperoxidase family enzyme